MGRPLGFSPAELARLGLSREMLGQAERLELPRTPVDQARAVSAPLAADSGEPFVMEARSAVLDALGLGLGLAREVGVLHVRPLGDQAFRIRAALPEAAEWPAGAGGLVRVALRQVGRFVIESREGAPLALGWLENDAIVLQPVYAWPTPPLEDWTVKTNDPWMHDTLARGRRGDTWDRTVCAGLLARLALPDPVDVSALMARGDVAALSRALPLEPRIWARQLERAAAESIEAHALRRASRLSEDLADLFDTLSLDGLEAAAEWRALCHRRDDLESIRLLLYEAGAGARLDVVLAEADRTGRAVRGNLGAAVEATDERLRRVALGDPAAWWGSTDYQPHIF